MMKTETIWLQRPASDVPWGFRLRGGRDYPYPLTVQRVSPGSIAATGLAVGDVILQIADIDTSNLSFAQSQDLIKDCGNLLQFHIAKGGGKASSVPSSPQPRQQQPSLQQQQSQPSPQLQVASPSAADMASGVHDLFRDMYRNSGHMAPTPDPPYLPIASGAVSPGSGGPYGNHSHQVQPPLYGNDTYSSAPRKIDIQHLGSSSHNRDNERPAARQIQIQHLGSSQSDPRYTPAQHQFNIQDMGSGGDHGSRVIPINSSPAAIDNSFSCSTQPEPPSYNNLESQAIRVQSPTVHRDTFSASPQYPYQAGSVPEPSYPYKPAAPNSTNDAVGPYNPVSSQSSTSSGPPWSSSDAGEAFGNNSRSSGQSMRPKLQRQNVSSSSGEKPSSTSVGGRRTPSYAGFAYDQSPSRAQASSPSLGNVQSPTYGGVQSPINNGVQSPRYGSTQPVSRQMSNPANVQSPTYGGVQSPTYGGVQSPTYGGVQSPTYGGVQSPTYGGVQSPTYGGVQNPTYGGIQSPTYGGVQSPTYGEGQSPRVYGSANQPSYGQPSPSVSSPIQSQSSQNENTPYSPPTNTTPQQFGVQSPDNQTTNSPSAYGSTPYDPYAPRTPQGFRSVQPSLSSPKPTSASTAPSFNQSYSPYTGPSGHSPSVNPTSPQVNSPNTYIGQTQTPQFNQYTPSSPNTQPPLSSQSSQNAPSKYTMLNQTNLQDTQCDSHPPGAPDIYSLQQPPSLGTDNGGSPGGPPSAPPVPAPPPPKPISPTPPRPRPSSRTEPRPSSQQEHRIPDAVLNMAAKGPPEKKPFTYAPSADILKEQREKVRRKPQGASLPRYQNLLNMPSFDDSPPTVQKVPQSPTAQAVNQADLTKDGVVAHAQYNSPLNVYSDDAVNETFAAQTAGAVNVTPQRQGSKPGDQDVTQSPTYRIIHGLDPAKPSANRTVPQDELDQDAPVSQANGAHEERSSLQKLSSDDEQHPNRKPTAGTNAPSKPVRMPSRDDELKFSGTLKQSDIPSKSFQKLQKFTGVDELQHYEDQPAEEEEEIGGYDEASIRYRGSNIPSKSFKILQSMTGGPAELPPRPASRNKSRERELDGPDYQAPQNGAEMRYGGANIPSQSFKILQQSIGDDGRQVPDSGTGLPPDGIPGSIDRRRPRRRARSRSAQRGPPPPRVSTPSKDLDEPEPQRDFNEAAYLSGKVAILRDPSEVPAKPYKEIIDKPSREDTSADQEARHFDEQAFLQGKIPIMGNESQKEYAPKVKEDETPDWARRVKGKKGQDNFQDPLARRGSRDVITPDWAARAPSREGNIDGPAIAVDELGYLITAPKDQGEEKPEWAKKAEQKKFDEARILAAKAEAGKGKDEIDPKWKRHVQRRESLGTVTVDELGYLVNPAKANNGNKKADWQVTLEKKKGKKMFDERGNLIVGQDADEQQAPASSSKAEEDEPEENYRPFDERAFLMGRIPLVRGGEADLSIPPPPPTTKKPHVNEKAEEERLKRPFDEHAFLSGSLSITGGCLEGGSKPPRSSRSRRRYREKAPWERPGQEEEEEGFSSDAEFDERAFLRGKVPLVRQSSERDLYSNRDEGFSRIPSKAFRRLSRSVSREASREGSPDDGTLLMRRTQSDDRGAESDTGEPYSRMYYRGKNIPSKTFMKLQKNIRSYKPPREPVRDREQEGIDVDKAIEAISIGQHDPGKYMEQLKQQHEESTSGNTVEAVPKVESQQLQQQQLQQQQQQQLQQQQLQQQQQQQLQQQQLQQQQLQQQQLQQQQLQQQQQQKQQQQQLQQQQQKQQVAQQQLPQQQTQPQEPQKAQQQQQQMQLQQLQQQQKQQQLAQQQQLQQQKQQMAQQQLSQQPQQTQSQEQQKPQPQQQQMQQQQLQQQQQQKQQMAQQQLPQQQQPTQPQEQQKPQQQQQQMQQQQLQQQQQQKQQMAQQQLPQQQQPTQPQEQQKPQQQQEQQQPQEKHPQQPQQLQEQNKKADGGQEVFFDCLENHQTKKDNGHQAGQKNEAKPEADVTDF